LNKLSSYQNRIFVLTGNCRDLFCTPLNQKIYLDRLLHIYLKENLGYDSVAFLDSRGVYFFDVDSKTALQSNSVVKGKKMPYGLSKLKNRGLKVCKKEGDNDDIPNSCNKLRTTYNYNINEIVEFMVHHLKNQRQFAFIVYDDTLFEKLIPASDIGALFHGFLKNDIFKLDADIKNIIAFVGQKDRISTVNRYSNIGLEYIYNMDDSGEISGLAERIFIPPSGSDEIKRMLTLNLLNTDNKPSFEDVERFVDHLNGDFANQNLKLNLLDKGDQDAVKHYESLQTTYKYKNSEESAWNELNQLIGLTEIKDKVRDLVKGTERTKRTYIDDFPNIPNRVKTVDSSSLPRIRHIALLGSSGTGKTTLARLIARVLKEEGILEKGHLVESARKDFVGQYVGETSAKTNQLVQRSLGGILFIDEAYDLITGENDSYGKEALSQLVGHLSNYAGQFMVIFAGYKDETLKMLSDNAGISRRVELWYIEDYDEKELTEIMHFHLNKLDIKVDPSVFDNAGNYCYHVLLNQSKFSINNHFGNAGVITNIIDHAVKKCRRDRSKALMMHHFEDQDYFQQVNRGISQLDGFIGLESTKKELRTLFKRLKREKTLTVGHFVFTGNPGTGKTMVANILAQELCRLKIIKRAKVVSRSASQLIKGHIGGTEETFQKILNDSLGGVLFIDEAHQLAPQQAGASYGSNVINTLIPFMESNKDNLCVILAGYPAHMEKLWEYDPGLKGRFNRTIEFEDYSTDELLAIFKQEMDKEKSYSLSFEDDQFLLKAFEELKEKRHFANIRSLKNLIEKLKEAAIQNDVSNQHTVEIDKEHFKKALREVK